MVTINQTRPITIQSGTTTTKPSPSVTSANTHNETQTMNTVILKFSASLPWSSTNGMSSRLISPTTNGPSTKPITVHNTANSARGQNKIGRASGRERDGTYVYITVVDAQSHKKQNNHHNHA